MGGRRDGYGEGGQDYPYGSAGGYDFAQYATPIFQLIANDDSITETGLGVSDWATTLGTGTFAQSIDADRPDYVSPDVVNFDVANTEDILITGTGSSLDNLTLIMRIRIDTTGTVRYVLDLNGAADRLIFCLGTASTNMGFFDTTFRTGTTACPTGEVTLVFRYRAGAASNIWVDGVKGADITVTTAGRTMGTSGRIGRASTTNSAHIDAGIKHMILYPDLTDAQIADILANI